MEDIHFAPGWGDHTKGNYWSYADLWWLDPKATIDAGSLQENLQVYHSTPVNRNITARKILKDKVVPTLATIKKITAIAGDLQIFSGSIQMLDYKTQSPVTLNTMIHLKGCWDDKHTAVFVEIPPGPCKDIICQQIERFQTSFSCV